MSATITIEDLLGPEGWDDAVHPARLAAETEFLIAESMQTLLLNMRARLLRAGDPAAEDGAMAAAVRQLADAQRGLNHLSLIQSRLVRTYRADAAFDDARDEVRLSHRDRLRTFAGAAIAANMPEAKRRSDARKEVEARLARITAAFQAAAGNEAAAEAQDHETPSDAPVQAPQDDCAQSHFECP